MAHFRAMFDNKHLGAWDLKERDVVVTIASVTSGKVGGQQGRAESKKAILAFERTEKTMVCNVTNASAIAGMYGNDTTKWIGKRITLYPTTTSVGAKMVDCIRVRPTIPNGKKRSEGVESQPVDQEMRARQMDAAGELDDGSVPADQEPPIESGGESDGDR